MPRLHRPAPLFGPRLAGPLLLSLLLAAAPAAAQPVCCAIPAPSDAHAVAVDLRDALAGADWPAIAALTHPSDLAALRAVLGPIPPGETDGAGRPLSDYSDAELYAFLLSAADAFSEAVGDTGFVAAYDVRLLGLTPAARDTAYAVLHQRWTYTPEAQALGLPLPAEYVAVKPIVRHGAGWFVGIPGHEMNAFRAAAEFWSYGVDDAPIEDGAPAQDDAPIESGEAPPEIDWDAWFEAGRLFDDVAFAYAAADADGLLAHLHADALAQFGRRARTALGSDAGDRTDAELLRSLLADAAAVRAEHGLGLLVHQGQEIDDQVRADFDLFPSVFLLAYDLPDGVDDAVRALVEDEVGTWRTALGRAAHVDGAWRLGRSELVDTLADELLAYHRHLRAAGGARP